VKESDLRAPVLAHLAAQGYRAWASPDGRDYFDIVALRGEEVGLVELKLRAARQLFGQAQRRRAWANWVAVAMPGQKAATSILGRPTTPVAARIGVWWVDGTIVHELRPAQRLYAEGEPDPFAEARAMLRAQLAQVADGTVPEGVDWGLFGAPRLPGAHRRSTRDWRLEEFGAEVTTEASGRRASRSAPPSDRS
jgi:hypothetical protein